MKGYTVFILKKGDNVGSLKDSKEILVLNIDNGESTIIDNKYSDKGIDFLEELFDEYDPSLIFISNIDDETRFNIEENGVKVIETGHRDIRGLREELFLY